MKDKYSFKEAAEEFLSFCMKKPMRNYVLFFLLFMMCLLLFISSKLIFIILVLLIINIILSLVIRGFKSIASGIEIVTFSTVLCSVAYGPKTGFLVGGLFVVVSLICLGRFTNYAGVMVPAVMLLGYLSFYFSSLGITAVGIIMTLVYNLIVILGIVLFLGGNAMKGMSYIGVNLALNIFLFSTLAPIILKIAVA